MISMTLVFFETNQIHSLGFRQTITKEKLSELYFLKGLSGPQYSTVITDVLKMEFPICDVGRGQFGKPPVFSKGNPHL